MNLATGRKKSAFINEIKGKQLSALNRFVKTTGGITDEESLMLQCCKTIRNAYPFPDLVSVKIKYDQKEYHVGISSGKNQKKRFFFTTADKKKGTVTVYLPTGYKEESLYHDFYANLFSHLTGTLSKIRLKTLVHQYTERLKELKGINRTAEILKSSLSLEASLQQICSFLPEAWQYPEHAVARIVYEGKVYTSKNFKETRWVQRKDFETSDKKKGSIEIFYLKKFPEADEGPFLKEERDLLNNLAALIAGMASKTSLQELLYQNTERLKELRALNKTSAILSQGKSLEESLQVICQILPEAWQYPEYTAAKIQYEDKVFTTPNYRETKWKQVQSFEAPGNKKGFIEICYLKEFPEIYEGPFMKEERNLLINLSNLIAGSAIKDLFHKLSHENKERLKELAAINQTSEIIAGNLPIDETLQKICDILPASWQYPEYAAAHIQYGEKSFFSKGFRYTQWIQKENFITLDNIKGCIEIVYLKSFPAEYEGPFLKEERNLLINIGKLISGYLNSIKGRELLHKKETGSKAKGNAEEYRRSLQRSEKPLQLFFNQRMLEKYIYLDMMKYKVREILFVSTLYDAFILEKEDSFFERYMGIIYQYSLFSLPRITGVSSHEEALALLNSTPFDLVILMVGIDKESPLALSKKIKEAHPQIPVYLLLNQKSNLKYFDEIVPALPSIDKTFVWYGSSDILFAIVKSTEDEMNVENDTRIGLVRVILLVEDSAQYYSKFLQHLYSIVFEQVQQLLPEVEKNELEKISKMRSRPKILLARNYEEALSLFNRYKDFMLCVITDMEFEVNGKPDKEAGLKFIRYIHSQIPKLPVILQSSDPANKTYADQLETGFLDKNSENLRNELQQFLVSYLGFGDFVFRKPDGTPIAVAKSLREFELLFQQVPDESIMMHSNANQFSIWLMARGEIELARTLKPITISDFPSMKDFRNYFIQTLRSYKEEKKKGRVLSFEETSILDEKNIVRLSKGSLGGKGRGLAFATTLLYNTDWGELSKRINILTPITVIIGTDEFERFIERNNLWPYLTNPEISYDTLREHFVKASLSDDLIRKLEVFLEQINKPIAVRSSSMSEDSLTQPFSGIFDTYIIPNTGHDKQQLLDNLITTIKLVYASVYSDSAKNYFHAIRHRVEDEKMAVVLQELVGHPYGQYYFPHISGVAQSYNYYPLAYMKPEEGVALAAVGLGTYVVQGWKSYRFSPAYPEIDTYTIKDMLANTQTSFYALDCSQNKIDFLKGGELASLVMANISELEKYDIFKHCLSYYNPANDRIEPGMGGKGPRIVNFANILKYGYIPLAETIQQLLETIKDAFGSPVEIEYVVDLTPGKNNLPTFYLLQIKPMVSVQMNTLSPSFSSLPPEKMILFSTNSLGNGELTHLQDIIFVDIHHFDKMKTNEMAGEIDYLNKLMIQQNTPYILIGPGRWGTREKTLGIPVNWSQISEAKVIVETSLSDFPLDASLGSHFFHNITSMNIGYFAVHDSSPTDFIRWEKLYAMPVVQRTDHFIHVRFDTPLAVYMNGLKKTAVITENTLPYE